MTPLPTPRTDADTYDVLDDAIADLAHRRGLWLGDELILIHLLASLIDQALWPASQISDTGPYRVRTGMEDGKCQNGAGSIRPSLRTRR